MCRGARCTFSDLRLVVTDCLLFGALLCDESIACDASMIAQLPCARWSSKGQSVSGLVLGQHSLHVVFD